MFDESNKKIIKVVMYVMIFIFLIIFFMYIRKEDMKGYDNFEVDYTDLDYNDEVEIDYDGVEETTLYTLDARDYIDNIIKGKTIMYTLYTFSYKPGSDEVMRKSKYDIYSDNTCILQMYTERENHFIVGTLDTDLNAIQNIMTSNKQEMVEIDDAGFTYEEGFFYQEGILEYYWNMDTKGYKEIVELINKSKLKTNKNITILRSTYE